VSTIIALTNKPSPRLADCQLTWLSREPISHELALLQHAAYGEALAECGARVVALSVNGDAPDGVFVEDTAVVLDEVAVLASMGAESRRGETHEIGEALRAYRDVVRIQPPARLDGGDVVVAGKRILVGLSSRTDKAGVQAMRDLAGAFGYKVDAVRVTGCLHLKSACTVLPDGRLLVNSGWLEPSDLSGFSLVPVDTEEEFAGDVACVMDTVVASAAFPRTNSRLQELGFSVRQVDLSEFAKAEGGVTCLSLIFQDS
jgi:dimethylargininase